MATTDSVDPPQFSTNERAEQVMGRRLTPEQEATGIVAIDYPVELGYRCPVHKRTMADHDRATPSAVRPLLEWSEYNGFLWCPECDRDWPTPFCVPLDNPEESAFDKEAGPDDAVNVFLDVVAQTVWTRVSRIACPQCGHALGDHGESIGCIPPCECDHSNRPDYADNDEAPAT